MAFTGTTATEAEIDQKSGANVSAAFTDTMKTQSLLQHEAWLVDETLYDWVTNWATVPTVKRVIVTSITASLVAIDAINYDPDAIGRSTAIHKVNVLNDIAIRGVKTLNASPNRTFTKRT